MNHEYMYPKVTPLRSGMAALVPAGRREAAAQAASGQGEQPPVVQEAVAPSPAVALAPSELG